MDDPEKLTTMAHKRQDEDKQNRKHNAICVGHHFINHSSKCVELIYVNF